MSTQTSPRIQMRFHHEDAVITLDGVDYGTTATNARNLIQASKVIRSTRLTANWHRDEGNVAKADELALWEIDFMERMRARKCDRIILALIEDEQ